MAIGKKHRRDAEREVAVHNRRANRDAIARGEPVHDGVLPFFCAFGKGNAAHHRRHKDGKHQRTDQSKGDRPGHRLEETAFNSLQRKDGQIGSDDDAAGKEDRPLHFMRRIANLLPWRALVVLDERDGGRYSRS